MLLFCLYGTGESMASVRRGASNRATVVAPAFEEARRIGVLLGDPCDIRPAGRQVLEQRSRPGCRDHRARRPRRLGAGSDNRQAKTHRQLDKCCSFCCLAVPQGAASLTGFSRDGSVRRFRRDGASQILQFEQHAQDTLELAVRGHFVAGQPEQRSREDATVGRNEWLRWSHGIRHINDALDIYDQPTNRSSC